MQHFYCLWFHTLKLSEKFKYNLWKKVKSCQKIYEGGEDFYRSLGIDYEKIQKIQESKQRLDNLKELYESLGSRNIIMTTIEDEDYPERLKSIDTPPIVFFLKGDIELVNWPSIAIVGARKCSEYGLSLIHI